MQLVSRRLITLGAAVMAAALALASTPGAASAAAKYVVDDDLVQCTTAGYSGIAGLQNAVSDAISHNVHTIEVCAGTYSNVAVTGANGLRIIGNDPNDRPLIAAPATDGGAVIEVENSNNVVLVGLHLSGEAFIDGGTNTISGVLYHNSSGVVQNNVIYGIKSFPSFSTALARAVSLIDDNNDSKRSNVTVTGNYITTYQTTGVYVEGMVKPTVAGNTIKGIDHMVFTTDVPLAGIDLVTTSSGMPSGSISKNYLYFNLTGIALRTTAKNTISGNLIEYSANGVLIDADCQVANTSADKNRVTGNTLIHISDNAVLVNATTSVSSPCASHANQMLISGNMLYANIDGEAVAIGGAVSSGGPFTASVDKIQIAKNTTWGFLNLWSITGATNPAIKTNTMFHL